MDGAGEESCLKLLRPKILTRMKLAKKKVQKLVKKAGIDRKRKRWNMVEDEIEEDYHSFWRNVKLPSMRSPNNANNCTYDELKKGLGKAMGPTHGVVLEPDTDENEDVSDPLESDFKVFTTCV